MNEGKRIMQIGMGCVIPVGGKMIFEKFTVGMRKETEILYRMYGSFWLCYG